MKRKKLLYSQPKPLKKRKWKQWKIGSYLTSGIGVAASLLPEGFFKRVPKVGNIIAYAPRVGNILAMIGTTSYSIFKNFETAQGIASLETQDISEFSQSLPESTKGQKTVSSDSEDEKDVLSTTDNIQQVKIKHSSYKAARCNFISQSVFGGIATTAYFLPMMLKDMEPAQIITSLMVFTQYFTHFFSAHRLNILRTKANKLREPEQLSSQLIDQRVQKITELQAKRQKILQAIDNLKSEMANENTQLNQLLRRRLVIETQTSETKKEQSDVSHEIDRINKKINQIDGSISQKEAELGEIRNSFVEIKTKPIITDFSVLTNLFPQSAAFFSMPAIYQELDRDSKAESSDTGGP